MIATLIAVLGTLAGSAIAHLSQRAHYRAANTQAHRTAALAATTDLATALADHRRAMWIREDLRLGGQNWNEARAESHTTRSAITAPLLRVQLLMPAVAPAATAAAHATYALRSAPDSSGLAARRDAAITACDNLVAAAGRHLTTTNQRTRTAIGA